MAEHIRRGEFHLGYPADALQDLHRVLEARSLPLGEVHLARITRNDSFTVRPHTGKEHLHLCNRGVLRFVQDDEGAFEGAAAHVGEGSDLDRAGLLVTAELLGGQQLGEAVVDRAKVRGNLFLQVTGQESQGFARLDCRAYKANAFGLMALEACDSKRHREEGLAGTGRAFRKDDIVFPDRLHQFGLGRRLRGDGNAEAVPEYGGVRDSFTQFPHLRSKKPFHVGSRKHVTIPGRHLELVQHRKDAFDIGVLARLDGKTRQAGLYLNAKTALQ